MSWATFLSSAVGALLGGGVSTAIVNQFFKIQEKNRSRRTEFAELELEYVSRWIEPTAVPRIDQMRTLRPKAMITGYHAYEIAEWTTKAVARINNSKEIEGNGKKRSTTFWELSSQLGEKLSHWVRHPHLKRFWKTPFEYDGVMSDSEYKQYQITQGGSVNH